VNALNLDVPAPDQHVSSWHQMDQSRRPDDVRSSGKTGRGRHLAKLTRLTQLGHGTTPPTADPDCRISNWWRSARRCWNDFTNLVMNSRRSIGRIAFDPRQPQHLNPIPNQRYFRCPPSRPRSIAHDITGSIAIEPERLNHRLFRQTKNIKKKNEKLAKGMMMQYSTNAEPTPP
jgi:hypothetical protein